MYKYILQFVQNYGIIIVIRTFSREIYLAKGVYFEKLKLYVQRDTSIRGFRRR